MTPFFSDAWLQVYGGDCRTVLRELPAESVHCVVTSPPYWGLRDYGTATWEGGDPGCDHAKPAVPHTGLAEAAERSDGKHRDESGTRAAKELQPYRDTCGKCGAHRIDAQLGLEATPELYVAALVDVFREVRRVLRDDGTVWLNLGDSYASGGERSTGRNDTDRETPGGRGGSFRGGVRQLTDQRDGLKPKDLVGIPWRVAFALQQPYYTGRIKSEADRIWLAAMVDAEGCIHIHRRAAGSSAHSTYERKDGTTANYVRKNDTFGVMVSVDNTSQAIVDRCAAIFGQGSRYVDEAGTKVQQRKQTLYRWTVTGDQARDLLRELYPHLIAKQHQARIAIGSPSSGGADAQEAVKALHAGREVTLDYPAPASLYEPGWYLRSDVIWAKSNPMPESVTDRPTKSHEYVFLLSKSARYFWDADAVREPHKWQDESELAVNAQARQQKRLAERAFAGDASALRTQDTYKAAIRGERGKGRYADVGTEQNYSMSPAGRNLRSVWTIATAPYPGSHFATFPPKLVEPCIKAGTSERGVCPECGAPWVRVVEREKHPDRDMEAQRQHAAVTTGRTDGRVPGPSGMVDRTMTTGWRRSCSHEAEPVPATVLDIFAGTGTTLLVAQHLGRRAIGIDLNPDYLSQCLARNRQVPLGLGA